MGGTHPTGMHSCKKIVILTDHIMHILKISLYASVCNNAVVMWPLLIKLIVSFYTKNNTGKIYVTQGKHREFHLG